MAPRIFMILLKIKKNQSLSLPPLKFGKPICSGRKNNEIRLVDPDCYGSYL